MDGFPNEIRKITEAIDLVVQYKCHRSWSKFYISSVGHKVIVLGHTWLAEHNPNINWRTGEVKMTCCPDYCGRTEADTGQPEGITSSQPVSEIWNPSERIHATSTVSMQLAEAAKGDAPPIELKDVIPEMYLSFWDIFSKELFNELLEQKQWDHAIDLIPGSKSFSTKVYPISPVEQKELDDFLDENLSSGRIRPSKSPMASLVFFVKKKDGKLWLCYE